METNAAPESPAAVGRSSTGARLRKLSEELADLQAMSALRPVTLREVIARLRGRAYTLLLILLALPFCQPIPLPGLSTPIGLTIALIALRLALGQRPWLPKAMQRKELTAGFFGKVVGPAGRIVRGLEKLLRPRLAVLTRSPLLCSLHALVIFASAVALLLPLPIPFSNAFPAWVILLIAAGLLERDGLFIVAGYAVFASGVGFFVFLSHTMLWLLGLFKHWLAG